MVTRNCYHIEGNYSTRRVADTIYGNKKLSSYSICMFKPPGRTDCEQLIIYIPTKANIRNNSDEYNKANKCFETNPDPIHNQIWKKIIGSFFFDSFEEENQQNHSQHCNGNQTNH